MGFDGFQHQNSKRGDTDKVCMGNLKTIKTYQTVKTLSPTLMRFHQEVQSKESYADFIGKGLLAKLYSHLKELMMLYYYSYPYPEIWSLVKTSLPTNI